MWLRSVWAIHRELGVIAIEKDLLGLDRWGSNRHVDKGEVEVVVRVVCPGPASWSIV